MAVEKRLSSLESLVEKIAISQLNLQASVHKLSEEMREFKDEMQGFKEEMRMISRDLNKKWGELANRLGTIVEDLVAPNLPGVIEKAFGLSPPDDVLIRFKRYVKRKNLRKEVDLLIVFHDPKILFVNETKSQASKESIREFSHFIKSGLFQEIFPEYNRYKVIPVYSTIYLGEEHVRLLTEERIFAVQIEGDILTIKNVEEIRPNYF